MIQLYMLSYDTITGLHLESQLLAFVRNNKHIERWLKPYPGLYLVVSRATYDQLADGFFEFFGGQVHHMIAPIMGKKTFGGLTEEYWSWINNNGLVLPSLSDGNS